MSGGTNVRRTFLMLYRGRAVWGVGQGTLQGREGRNEPACGDAYGEVG
jgi:hypothetical protein